jgi:hypothetical protein
MGRMGNALFQAAATIALALRNGAEFSIPTQTSHEFWSPLYLQHLVNPKWERGRVDRIITEQQFHYAEIEYNREWNNQQVMLQGYWQSEKYFADFKDEIVRLFNFPWHHQGSVCSIHARYGDYLTIAGKHILIDDSYLTRAMKLITELTGIKRFKVFSDNLPLFKERHGNLYPFEYSTNNGIVEDLVEISSCHSHINSSSTFSWWAAYLNRNPHKTVITQMKWFQDGWDGANTNDIVPESWIKL